MSVLSKALAWLGLADDGNEPSSVKAPRFADRDSLVTTDRALSLSTVYRGIGIHATAACQLSIDVERHGVKLAAELISPLIKRPCIDMSRSAFLEFTVVCLYTDGNAFWELIRAGAGAAIPGSIVNIVPLNPHEVTVLKDRRTGVITYGYRGRTIAAADMKHLKLLRVPGQLRGLGPIQAARVELAGALDARDYGAMWLSESKVPDGVLTTDQVLKPGDGDGYVNVWYGRNADGSEKTESKARFNERLRVLGQGLRYEHSMLKPADVQFLETQQFTTTQIARLLGLPASLLLAAVEGNSQTYQNVEQEWIAYVRFSLMKSLREIEEAFTEIIPNGQTARLSLDVLFRTDTKTRMQIHKTAIEAGIYDEDHARSIEGLPPMTGAQRDALAERRKSTPTTTKEAA